jgi:hypothetical protein
VLHKKDAFFITDFAGVSFAGRCRYDHFQKFLKKKQRFPQCPHNILTADDRRPGVAFSFRLRHDFAETRCRGKHT